MLLRLHNPAQQYYQMTKRCEFAFILYCNDNNPKPDAFLPTGHSCVHEKPALFVNKNSLFTRRQVSRTIPYSFSIGLFTSDKNNSATIKHIYNGSAILIEDAKLVLMNPAALKKNLM